MIYLIGAWVGLAAFLLIFIVGRGERAGPLVMAYFFGLSMIHLPGAAAYVGAAAGMGTEHTVFTGFGALLLGMACLLVGALVGQRTAPPLPAPPPFNSARPVVYLTIGVIAYFFALPIAAVVPSATAIVGALGSMIIVGCWLFFHEAMRNGNRWRIAAGFLSVPLLPLSTMISGGFIGYGIYWMLAVAVEFYVGSRQKMIYLLAAPFVLIAGLSIAVSWIDNRDHLRELVWNQKASFEQRLEIVDRMASTFEFVNFNDRRHVEPFLLRMNESWTLGRGIERHTDGAVELKYGATVPLWAFVPRAIWADKPQVGGGQTLVADFTGLEVLPDVSVGTGQPLEFYMNFGLPGIILGFLLWGFILARLDLTIRQGIDHGKTGLLLKAALPGIAMLQPGGNLMEVAVAIVAGFVVAVAIEAALSRYVPSRAGAAPIRYGRPARNTRRPAQNDSM